MTALGDYYRGKMGRVKPEEDSAGASTKGARETSKLLKQFGGCTPQKPLLR